MRFHLLTIHVNGLTLSVKAQAERQFKPHVNGDTHSYRSLVWLSDFPLSSRGYTPTSLHEKWLKRRGFTQWCTFCSNHIPAVDTCDQPTSINWLYRAVSELQSIGHRAFSVAGLMVWNSLPTEFRDLSVSLMFLGALLRWYLHDISASSAIEIYAWYCAI